MRRLALIFPCLLPLLLAAPASQAQYYDPCRDGRLSDGQPRTCKEIRRWLRHADREGHGREWRRKRYDPCTDGSVSDGRPRTCQELRRWFYNSDLQDWD